MERNLLFALTSRIFVAQKVITYRWKGHMIIYEKIMVYHQYGNNKYYKNSNDCKFQKRWHNTPMSVSVHVSSERLELLPSSYLVTRRIAIQGMHNKLLLTLVLMSRSPVKLKFSHKSTTNNEPKSPQGAPKGAAPSLRSPVHWKSIGI